MGNFEASAEAWWPLAATISLGIAIILLGSLALMAVFLSDRRWLSNKIGKIAASAFYFFICSFYVLLVPFVMPRIFTPQPSHSDYLVSGLLFSTLFLITIPIGGVSSLVTRLTTTPANQPPAPEIKWVRLCWAPVEGLVLGLALGLLIGWLLGALLPYLPYGSIDASHPLFQRASVLFTLAAGGSIGLVCGLMDPFLKWLEWWVKYLPRTHFARLGMSLIVIGSLIIGIAVWLIAP